MAPKKKQKKEEVELTQNDEFEKRLTTAGLASAMLLVDEQEDDNYEVVPTEWTSVNNLIGGDKAHLQGMPKHVHVEVFSEEPHVGKTTICLQIGVSWQKAKLKVAVIALESRIPTAYLKELGYITDKDQADALGIYAVRVLQPRIKPEDCSTEMVYAEQILDLLATASGIFDLLIIDSLDAMCLAADAAKSAEDNTQMGGVSKFIKAYIKKHTLPNATHLWINHMAEGMGQYAKKYTSGGKAVPRYSTIRLKLERVDLLRENDKAEPYGFVTKLSTVKNRVSAPFRFTLLKYIFGEAFSTGFDYFDTALKTGILTKFGGWYYMLGEGKNEDERKKNCRWKYQGLIQSYRQLRDVDTEVFDEIKKLIDGEDVSAEDLSEEQTAEAKLASIAAEQDEAA